MHTRAAVFGPGSLRGHTGAADGRNDRPVGGRVDSEGPMGKAPLDSGLEQLSVLPCPAV